jgi:putative heme-binding domain-containing protein
VPAPLFTLVRLLTKVAIAGLTCLATLTAQSGLGAAAGGDPAAGKALFEGKGGCQSCHALDDKGGSFGPVLSEIGIMRSPESLRLALTDPDAEIYEEYLTIVAVTSRGERVEGIKLNEDDISIQVREPDGTPRSFLKENLKELHREERSLMPSYAARLSATEIDNLVAYLRTLRGEPPQPGAAAPRTRMIAPVSENLTWLNRPERDKDERPETLLDFLQIPAGSTVADLGAGSGYFTWRLARRVGPQGKVLAVDIQQEMLDLIAQDLKKRNVTNVELLLGGERDPRLPAGALDLVLIANAYHEFAEPEAILAAVRRSLKPNGRMVVLEYRKERSYTPMPSLHKMTMQEMRSEIEPAGFQLERALDFLPDQHGLIFTKRP